MAAKTVTCDVCGAEMPAEEAKHDIGSELDLCETHYRERQIAEAKDERARLEDWLNKTHLKRLLQLDAKIRKLESA